MLAHGPSFDIAPRGPPHGEYITTVDQACLGLKAYEAEELRAEIRGALKQK